MVATSGFEPGMSVDIARSTVVFLYGYTSGVVETTDDRYVWVRSCSQGVTRLLGLLPENLTPAHSEPQA